MDTLPQNTPLTPEGNEDTFTLRVRERRTSLQNIKMFLLGDVEELSAKDSEIHERLEWISLNRTVMRRQKLIKKYCEKFSVREGTALRDMNLATQLYGDVMTRQKEGLRALWIDRMDATYIKAMKEKDLKAATAAAAVSARLLGNPDKEVFIPNEDEIGNNLYVFAVSAGMEKNMADIAEMLKKTGKFDLSKMPVEDAEYEPLTPEGNPLTTSNDDDARE
jgi:hypothetical protein